MDFKTVLVELGNDEGAETRIEAAAALAALGGSGGHVIGVTATGFRPDPFRGAGEEAGRYAEQAQRSQQERGEADASRLRRIVAQAAPGVSCAHCLLEEDAGWALATQSRVADIVLLARPPVPDMAPVLVAQTAEYVLLHAGRPVLVMPPQVRRVDARHVAVAWDGRREAARAVADALPLLRRAERVSLITVDPDGRGEALSEGLGEYLGRHGIAAQPFPVPSQEAVGPALLRAVGHLQADLLVAGGYGHSRMRELVMGGATRVLLRHAEVPLLVSH